MQSELREYLDQFPGMLDDIDNHFGECTTEKEAFISKVQAWYKPGMPVNQASRFSIERHFLDFDTAYQHLSLPIHQGHPLPEHAVQLSESSEKVDMFESKKASRQPHFIQTQNQQAHTKPGISDEHEVQKPPESPKVTKEQLSKPIPLTARRPKNDQGFYYEFSQEKLREFL